MNIQEYNFDDFEHVTLSGDMAYIRTDEYISAANVRPVADPAELEDMQALGNGNYIRGGFDNE